MGVWGEGKVCVRVRGAVRVGRERLCSFATRFGILVLFCGVLGW